jgi:hypothetical protein
MKLFNQFFLSFISIIFFFSCSKEDDDVNGGNNNNNNVIEYTQSWIVPSDNHIMPVADNHKSDILKVYKFGNKEFHYYHVFTNAQHQYYLCKFENDAWQNCFNSPNGMKLAASDDKIGEIVLSSQNSAQDLITTRFFDPISESFSVFKSQIFDIKFISVALVATSSDFYMIAKRQVIGGLGDAIMYKWNTTNEEWEVLIENIPESVEWNSAVYDIFRSRNGEFIYKNTNNSGVNFYEFKNNQFNRIYRGGSNEIILMRGARLHLINNNYTLVFDKVYNVGAGNSLSEYYTPGENLSILQSSVDGNKLILTIGSYSWNGTTYVQKIVVLNMLNGKIYELPAVVEYAGYDGWQMTNRYDVDQWQFRFNSENKLEGLVHFEYNGPFGQTKLYRVVYPLVLD